MTQHTTVRMVKTPATYENNAWRWMRYSAFLLIPLVWGHVLIQDIVVGVHSMDLGYVADRWASIFWRSYDGLLLGFAFAHGINGLRQVLRDFIHSVKARKTLDYALLIFWAAIFIFGFVALLAGVNQPLPIK
jgi:succinate dehydrogenase / fumarate reductase membrane anchor subunit